MQVGGLVGYSSGDIGTADIENSYATGAVTGLGADRGSGGLQIGGLVGQNIGADGFALISDSYASGTVKAGDATGVGFAGIQAGGLVGANIGSGDPGYYNDAAQVYGGYATGAVTVGAAQNGGAIRVGGLIGYNDGDDGTASVYSAYATGAIRSGAGAQVGGLIGYNDPDRGTAHVQNSYFDTQTTLQSDDGALATGGDASTGSIGLTTAQFMDATSPISGLDVGAFPATFVIVDSDGTLNGANGATFPLLRSEYNTTITNAHQLQLMALDTSAAYTLAANIDSSGTSNSSDVWGSAGFVPVGSASTPFTGTLNGAGYSVSGLTINAPSASNVGLVGVLGASGALEALTVTGKVVGGTDVGILVGYNAGMVSGASGKGSVTGASDVGGVAGYTSGSISGSSSKAAVSGAPSQTANAKQDIGGVAGFNAGAMNQDHANGAVIGEGAVGGLVGTNSGLVTNSYSSGAVSTVSGKSFLQSRIGGLVGANTGQVIADYATGTVTGDTQVGGLVGFNKTVGTISSAYATGAVKGLTGSGAPSDSGIGIGGLVV